ncbi:MAG: hypothetical protein A6F71_10280 [Cycloclasticus sp. symbiont of Poecilosclerida sp. M]|nr:MAG: hypothetical protein A6F71_10280 [Cycloclasticus sp. symbiont of Poecilosclerida sp. M]
MFAEDSYTFNEEDGSGMIEIVKSDSIDESFTVLVYGGPSEQTDVAVSAEGINTIVTFEAGPGASDSIFISFGINDDEVGLEAVETYTVVFEILSSTDLVFPGMITETTVNILDTDSKNNYTYIPLAHTKLASYILQTTVGSY